ncbi:hypothetical protein CRUP_037559 [Coryphaenoides rupestris]|nr:hypothetical protein CRUP_037559 [Coryphaenoides rupestris]
MKMKPVRNWIAEEYKNEIIQLLKLAVPMLMTFMVGFVSMVFCGHLGKNELNAVALAIATFGSGNLKQVGVILQRGILILLLACFPCWAILINTQSILLAVRQNAEVARLSQLYVEIVMPSLPGMMWAQVITGVMGNIINLLTNYIFLNLLDLGVAGSAAANAISQYSLAVFLYIYICCRGLHRATWAGWSCDCLQEWGPFSRLAVSSMLMHCFSWWVYEAGGFLAGLISEVELGAQAILYELAGFVYMIPMGMTVAASVRVGSALGAGNTEQAKLSAKVSTIYTVIVACFVGVFLGVSRDVIGYIFTTEPEIAQRVADVMIMYGFVHVSEAIAGVTGGIIRGVGKQRVGALSTLIGYYVIGLPIGLSLMFPAGMGIVGEDELSIKYDHFTVITVIIKNLSSFSGLWLGLLICVIFETAFYLLYLSKMNWQTVTEEARAPQGGPLPELDAPGSCHPGQSGSAISGGGRVLSGRQLAVRRGLALLLMSLILAAGVLTNKMLLWFYY